MKNPFDVAIDTIFKNNDFLERCFINGREYKCIVYPITTDEGFTEFGLSDGINFKISIKTADCSKPKKSQTVKYRNREYLVSSVEEDSAGLTYSINLKSKNSE